MAISRIPVTTRAPRQGFGLFAFVESRRVVLPLKGVECDFSVVSGISEVSMTQIFRQDNQKPMDCEYLFPLPADAAVYFCEADINGRTIRAQVRERNEARQIAAEKKAAGCRTALVEAERDNLFTLSLGNVQPGDVVIIQLKYFQTLRSLAGMPSIEIPFCPGVRYIPGSPLLRSNKGKGTVDDTNEVPDASRITPVRIDAEHPDAAYIEVRGTLDGKYVNEKELSSPSHQLTVDRSGDQVRVSLAHKGDVPNRDFVLRWTEQAVGAVASRAWLRQKAQGTYALLEIRAPKAAPAERAPVDFYFLVDRSGSMAGQKWSKAAEALQSCMKVLGPADRAMVTFFETEFQDFAERPLSPQELLRDPKFQSVAKLGTAGGTELRPALKHVLKLASKHSLSSYRNLILITDAEIGNESAILELMKDARDFPVHCFGIDVALNDSLLLALCRQQGGTFHSLNPHDDIEQAVASLGQTLGQPVLLDLRLPAGWETADAAIPNLYAGQIHYLSAHASRNQPLELSARSAASEPVTIRFESQTADLEAPYLHFCRARIQRLVAEGNERAAVKLSVQSNLICPLTAFIAWDESEKVPIAIHELVQPPQALYETLFASSSLYREFQAEREEILKHKWLESTPPGADFEVALTRWITRHRREFRRSAASDHQPPAIQLPKPSDELDLKRELSELCHRTGIVDWQPLVRTIFDWVAEAGGTKRSKRLQAFRRLVEELKTLAERYAQLQARHELKDAEAVRARLEQALKEFVEKLPARK